MGSDAGANSLLQHASRLVPGNPDLKRVTILASRPDATVVVQADYYSRGATPSLPALPAAEQSAARSMTVSGTSSEMPSRSSMSTHVTPLQLYTRTQRGFDDSCRPALLDVRA